MSGHLHPETDKSLLRKELSAARASLSPHERAAAEAAIHARLFASPVWQAAPLVCGYMSTRGEIDMTPVWRETVRAGKTYALPVTLDASGTVVFRAAKHFSPERLTVGRFGIAEPPDGPDFPALSPAALAGALMLVPGLGFDAEGYRIGYGGGYYDRALAALEAAHIPVHTVGLCFAACRRPLLPREAHDRAVSLIIDERSPL